MKLSEPIVSPQATARPRARLPAVAYIVRSFPRLSQTFILNEILALESLGLDLRLFAMTHSDETVVQEGVAGVRAPTEYLEPARRRHMGSVLREHVSVAIRRPLAYLSTLAYVLRRRDLDDGYTTASRMVCFGHAVHVANRLRAARAQGVEIDHVHGHFAHDPTLIALLVKKLTAVSYSFTAHARDLYQVPRAALAERVAEATAVVTCCRANVDYLERVAPQGRSKVELIHHGVNLEAFRPPDAAPPPEHAPVILSVARLVPKKGFADLLCACRLLVEDGVRFHCEIYGEGPLREELDATIEHLGLAHAVALRGARTQAELVRAFQAADVFALTPFVTDDGDRDGIPNTLLEAMACGLPVVATAAGGIPEAVLHDRTGLLAAPHDVDAIADHLRMLLRDEAKRRRLGSRGRQAVVEGFDAGAAARRLAGVFSSTNERGPWPLSS